MPDGVLFLHAWPIDARLWDGQVNALADRLPVVAPDHPGFGGTPGTGAVMTMADAADSALTALDEARIDRAVVIGCSLGGYVAFELWRRAPARVRGLGLVTTRAVADTPEAAQGRAALAERLLAEGSGFMVNEPPALLAEGASPEMQERIRGWIADQPAASIAAAARGMAERPDSTPDLHRIDVPSLVVTAEGDRLIPPDVALSMTDDLPRAEGVLLPGAGHLPNLETPDSFDPVLFDFLRRCGLPA